MEVYKNEKYLSVLFNKDFNYLCYNWSHMAIPLDSLKETFTESTKFIEKYRITNLVADTSKAKSILFPECIEWWENYQNKLASVGINKIITVTSESALTRRTNKKWQSATGAIDLYEVPSLEEAEKVIG